MTAQRSSKTAAPAPPLSSFAGPRCDICFKAEDIDNPLVACTHCNVFYHRACHKSVLQTSFICTRCQLQIQRAKILKSSFSYDGIGPTPPAKTSLAPQSKSDSSVSGATSVESVNTDMLPSTAKGKPNPFLAEETDYWATTSSSKCRFPMCLNDADQNHLTCEVHSATKPSVSPKTMKNSDRPHATRHDSLQSLQSNGTRYSADASSSPSRKNLEARTTARKTITRRFLPPATDSKTTQNGHQPGITGLQRPVDQPSFGEEPARKKQRLNTPNSDEPTSRLANSASPLARPTGFPYGKPIGDDLHPSRLPTLSADIPSFPPEAAPAKEGAKPIPIISSYDNFINLKPLVLPRPASPDIPRLNIGAKHVGPAIASGYDTDMSSSDSSMNASLTKSGGFMDISKSQVNGSLDGHRPGKLKPRQTACPKSPAPTKASSDKGKSSMMKQPEEPSGSDEWITRTPPVERKRRHLVEQHKDDDGLDADLDAFIYGPTLMSCQPGVPLVGRPLPRIVPPDKAYCIPMDPRSQRTRPHSEDWFRQKEEEIRARGGRKPNLGKAAQRMTEQQRTENPKDLETTLPDRVRYNENLLGAAAFFSNYGRRNVGPSTAPAQSPLVPALVPVPASASAPAPAPAPTELATPVRVKRKYVRKQPLPQPALGKKPAGSDAA